MYTLFLQNNATKKEYYFDGLDNIGNPLYFEFKIDLDSLDGGEYTYALIFNERIDCEYELKDALLDTVIKTGEGNVILRDLEPELGLLRIVMDNESTEDVKPVYRDKNTDFTYYRKK